MALFVRLLFRVEVGSESRSGQLSAVTKSRGGGELC